MYDNYGPKMLIPAALILMIGQLIMVIYTPLKWSFAFVMMIIGRIFQGFGAEILYMGQGVLANKWMGNFVGLILVLPELGEIANAFLTPIFNVKGGLVLALGVGLAICIISFIASIPLYFIDKKYEHILHHSEN
jgi:MFS family permease